MRLGRALIYPKPVYRMPQDQTSLPGPCERLTIVGLLACWLLFSSASLNSGVRGQIPVSERGSAPTGLASHPLAGGLRNPAQKPREGGIIVQTTFSGPDRQTPLPAAETGQRWEVFSGTWGVLHHKAVNSRNSNITKTGDGNDVVVIDAGVSDCNVRAKLSGVMTNSTGLTFRAADAQNLFFVRASTESIEVYRKSAGNYVRLTKASSGVTDGDTLEVELRGSSIMIRVNGIERASLTDKFNRSATKHGLYSYDPNVGFVEFTVDTRSAAAEWIRIASPQAYQIFQRDDKGRSDIAISGLFGGQSTLIEARFNGNEWTVIGKAREGKFSGILPNQSAGQGRLEVRFADKPDVTFAQSYVGVGEVFLVAGQSNAEGRISAPQQYAHPRLRASVFDESLGWRDGYDPTDSSLPNEYSVWPLLATKIMAATDVPVAFITAAAPQTGLIGDGGTWAKGGPTYAKCLSMVRDSGVNAVRAVLWYQGESDANVPSMTQVQYETALLLLRKNLATDLGWPVKLMTAQIAHLHTDTSHETRASVDAVRLAQSSAPDNDPDILMGPMLYDLDIRVEAGGDGVHIQSPAHAEIEASRWWRMLRFYFFGGAEGRGPRFVSAKVFAGKEIDLAFKTTAGPLRVSSAVATGWRIIDANGTRRVLSGTLHNGVNIHLLLDQALLGRIEISWASYNDATGALLTDSAADAMPAEPFRTNVP